MDVRAHFFPHIRSTGTRCRPGRHSYKQWIRTPSCSAVSYMHYRQMFATIYCRNRGVPKGCFMLRGVQLWTVIEQPRLLWHALLEVLVLDNSTVLVQKAMLGTNFTKFGQRVTFLFGTWHLKKALKYCFGTVLLRALRSFRDFRSNFKKKLQGQFSNQSAQDMCPAFSSKNVSVLKT